MAIASISTRAPCEKTMKKRIRNLIYLFYEASGCVTQHCKNRVTFEGDYTSDSCITNLAMLSNTKNSLYSYLSIITPYF